MGKFTHCYIVVGSTAKALAPLYQGTGTHAFIFQDEHGCCAIVDDDDEAELDLLSEITAESQSIALLGQVFDSAVFVGTFFKHGMALDQYIDYPEYLSGFGVQSQLPLDRILSPKQRASEWASLFSAPDSADALAEVFRRRDEYAFAEDFYTALLESLALPSILAGASYRELELAYRNDPEARKALVHAGDSLL